MKALYLGGGEAFLDWGGGGRAGDRPRLAGSVELQIKKEKILPYQSGLQVSHIIKHKLKGIRKMEITPTNYLTIWTVNFELCTIEISHTMYTE